jgi:hypothetical protein
MLAEITAASVRGERTDADCHAGWRCVRGPEGRPGTNFSFRLEPTPKDTVLLCANAGLSATVSVLRPDHRPAETGSDRSSRRR